MKQAGRQLNWEVLTLRRGADGGGEKWSIQDTRSSNGQVRFHSVDSVDWEDRGRNKIGSKTHRKAEAQLGAGSVSGTRAHLEDSAGRWASVPTPSPTDPGAGGAGTRVPRVNRIQNRGSRRPRKLRGRGRGRAARARAPGPPLPRGQEPARVFPTPRSPAGTVRGAVAFPRRASHLTAIPGGRGPRPETAPGKRQTSKPVVAE